DRLAIDTENDVARLHAGERGCTLYFLDEESAFGARDLLLFVRQRTHEKAKLLRFIAALGTGRTRALGLGLFQLGGRHYFFLLLAVAPDAELGARARLQA